MSFNAAAGLGVALSVVLAASAPAVAATCPSATRPGALPGLSALRHDNAFLARLGARPTGSAAQRRYVDWIVGRLRHIPGLQLSRQTFAIERWQPRAATLRVGKRRLPVAGPVPYSRATPRHGVTGRLAYVPLGTTITAANARGRIVVRPAPAGTVPMGALLSPAISWESYDPGHTLNPMLTYEGDFIAYNDRVHDLQDAAAARAKALLFVKDLPRAQVRGHYEPYEGVRWRVPALFLGADEGATVQAAAARGARATVTLRTARARVRTSSVEAVLPGASRRRIVIDSHTDGTNAVEDNGPIAMVAMARYLSRLPRACRPRTVQFAFSTAHFFQRLRGGQQRHGGAGVLARQLDAEYDKERVAGVVVLEHLGAREYEPRPRRAGRPGERLALTGRSELQLIAVTPSPTLVAAVDAVVRRYDLRRTLLLQGADAPAATAPAHCNFGGEGTPYDDALLPTVAVISAPQSLYDPAFGLAGVDIRRMRAELLAYTDLVGRLQTMSASDIAGLVPAERAARANGTPVCGNGLG